MMLNLRIFCAVFVFYLTIENGIAKTNNLCSLPADPGNCDGQYGRYWFNIGTHTCDKFIYGGCGGNKNNFETLNECYSACLIACPRILCFGPCPFGYKEDQNGCLTCKCKPQRNQCQLPIQPGYCKGYFPKYGYNKKEQKCVKFIYGGCGGNANNFDTLKACQEACVKCPMRKCAPCINGHQLDERGCKTCTCNEDICKLKPEVGPCEAHILQYFFNPLTNQCEDFYYGGCGGNGNRFATYEECSEACVHPCPVPLCLEPCPNGYARDERNCLTCNCL